MEERFDEKLSAHIRDVFENYEDCDAYEGWNKLLLKQAEPDKKRKIIPLWYWLGPAVAAIFVFFAFNINILNVQKSNEAVPVITKNTKALPEAQSRTESHKDEGSRLTTVGKSHEETPLLADDQLAVVSDNKATLINQPVVSWYSAEPTVNYDEELAALQKYSGNVPQQANTLSRPSMKLAAVKTTVNSQHNIENEDKVKEYVAGEGKKKKKDNVDVGFLAGSFMSYSKGAENNTLGYKAGLDVEIPIASNVHISTGLNLGHQSLTFANDNKLPTGLSAKMNTLYSMGTLDDYKASMLAIDLPINVKVVFPGDKHSWFVSGGLSSYSYLEDSYEASYTQAYSSPNVSGSTMAFATTEFSNEDNSGKLFSRIDWFRTFNMSFGIDYNLKKNKLTVEPYLKYPLGGLGAEQIKWTTAGLNLKFSFGK